MYMYMRVDNKITAYVRRIMVYNTENGFGLVEIETNLTDTIRQTVGRQERGRESD